MHENVLSKQTIAMIFLAVGGLFLFCNLFSLLIGTFWAFLFIMMPGFVFLTLGFNNTPTRFMVIPGAMITGTGLILQIMSILGHWEALAYVWTLYGVFLGMAFLYVGEYEEESLKSVGSWFVRLSLGAFLFLGLTFETLFFHSFGSFGTWVVAFLLLWAGYYMLRDEVDLGMFDFRRHKAKPKRKNREASPEKAGIYEV